MPPTTPPPAAESAPLSWPLKIWFGLIALGIFGEFALMLIGLLVYRDTRNHTLYGNPWEPSNFPWHVIWGFRLMTILAGLVVVPLAVRAVAVPFRLLFIKFFGDTARKPALLVLAHVLAALVLLLLVARIEGWWGLGAVPQS